MTGSHRSLAVLGAGEQLAADIQHVLNSVGLAQDGGEEVDIEAIWTKDPVVITFPADGGLLETRVLDETAALELADIDLARFELPDEHLNRREILMKRAIEAAGVTTQTAREGFANTFSRLGGAAIFEGSLSGVTVAAGYYQDLRQLGN